MLRLAVALFLVQTGFHAFIASLPLAMVAAGRPDAVIGAVMGAAAVVQIPAAFVAGGLIDRFGGRAIFLASAASFMAGAALLASGLAVPGGSLGLLVAVRCLQGLGMAACLPAALSLVPGLVRPARLATGLSLVSLAANVSMAIAPPAGLATLDLGTLQLLSTLVLATVTAGVGLGWSLARMEPARRGDGAAADAGPPARAAASTPRRTFRPAWRPAWGLWLLASLLYVVHWGILTGYLPQRAEAAGADVSLLFSADAVSLIVLRMPVAWLADRSGTHLLAVAGLAVTVAALCLLLVPPTTPLLVVAGLGTGTGAALVLPPITLELSRRSDDSDRGSAFALYSVAFAAGMALGSEALAPVIDAIGFPTAMLVGILAVLAAAAAVAVDRRLVADALPSIA